MPTVENLRAAQWGTRRPSKRINFHAFAVDERWCLGIQHSAAQFECWSTVFELGEFAHTVRLCNRIREKYWKRRSREQPEFCGGYCRSAFRANARTACELLTDQPRPLAATDKTSRKTERSSNFFKTIKDPRFMVDFWQAYRVYELSNGVQ